MQWIDASLPAVQLRLAKQPTPEGLTVALDESGNYYLCGYGGMGSRHWRKLKEDHPFVAHIEALIAKGDLIEGPPKYTYEAGGIVVDRTYISSSLEGWNVNN